MFRLFFIIMFFIISLSCKLVALENKILFKVDNEIITTIDISNEINYLKMINKEIKIPKHWKLSDNHNNIIKDMISSYYKIFEKFYNDPQIIPYLNQFQDQFHYNIY